MPYRLYMFERTKNTIDWVKEHRFISRIILFVGLFFVVLIFLGGVYDYSTEITLVASLFIAFFLTALTTKKFWKALRVFGKGLEKSGEEFGKRYQEPIERRKRAYDEQIGRKLANRDFNKQEKNRKVSYKI